MNNQTLPTDDLKLRQLLRASQSKPDLPADFQEAIWRRIEKAQGSGQKASWDWLERLAAWFLHLRFALAGAFTVLFLGAFLGGVQGIHLSREAAQARYLAAVSPWMSQP
jgi:uncharacterized membrane protein YraQ (UPF0718 family)